MKYHTDVLIFTQLFVSEQKQIAMMADEKSPVRISHRRFATSCLEVRIIMRRIVNERNTKRKKAAIILKRTAVVAMCVILAAGMRQKDGQRAERKCFRK